MKSGIHPLCHGISSGHPSSFHSYYRSGLLLVNLMSSSSALVSHDAFVVTISIFASVSAIMMTLALGFAELFESSYFSALCFDI
jgi:hypothetical protein